MPIVENWERGYISEFKTVQPIGQNKEKQIRFDIKITKAKLLVPKIRKQLDLIYSFLFELKKKPEVLEQTELSLQKLLKKMPKFSQDEQYHFLNNIYDIVEKYWICLYCKRDLRTLRVDNENYQTRIICNDCGTTYYNPDKKASEPCIPSSGIYIPNIEPIIVEESTSDWTYVGSSSDIRVSGGTNT